ncbi:MAG: AbrB/MazE/SpoVT family DNA-binding domain-containing protein [Methylococcaceae bacterium]|nr:AbrB/MazE/SpoVT family DNA-binding domain-containing protein [Methylococcaceae bacterium]
MQTERHVNLFRNGRNQAIRIPRDFELEGTEAIIRKEGNKLIIEAVKKKSLKQVLASLPTLDEEFPEIVDSMVEAEDIF